MVVLLLITVSACKGKEKKDPLTNYYHEYLVALHENELNKVQVVATFRAGDEHGKPQALPEDYTVYLDTQKITLATDPYPDYAMEKDRAGFVGKHQWVIKKGTETVLEIPFQFTFFRLTDSIPSVIGNTAIVFRTEGLPDGEKIECWFDNSELNNEKDRFSYPLKNNAVEIPAPDLQQLKEGRYNLTISYVQKIPVLLQGKQTGLLDVSYILEGIPVQVR
jgi:hypothetical protein